MTTEEQTIRALPERPVRHCPVCGARIADGTTTCLICGTQLTEDTEAASDAVPEPEPATAAQSRRSQILRILLLGLIAVVILSGAVVLGLRLGSGAVAPELPTFTPTITTTPTDTPTPTVTPTPTQTPTPTLTPTPVPPINYTVQEGDTLGAVALEFDLTVEEIMAYNGMDSDLITAGDVLLIPPPTPTPGPTPTPVPGEPTATPAAFALHTVRAGDTLSTIGEEYGVSVAAIRQANDIPEDSEDIVVNQVLTIPLSTPTPMPEVATEVTPTPTPGVIKYPAPPMLYPPNGATFVGPDAVIALQWASVGILESRESYQLELLVPGENERTTIRVYLRSTVWRVPADLLPPENVTDRTLSWRVFVVRQVGEGDDATYRIISTAGRRNTFTWTYE